MKMTKKLCSSSIIYLALLLVQTNGLTFEEAAESFILEKNEYTFTTSDEDGSNTMVTYNNVTKAWVGHAQYNQTYLKTGWDTLDIVTNSTEKDEEQAYVAGYQEGYLTQKAIYDHHYNTIRLACKGEEVICEKVDKFIVKNMQWIWHMVKEKADTDPYWNQVRLFYVQVMGIYKGYNHACSGNETCLISLRDLLWMNYIWDISDLKSSVKNETQKSLRGAGDHCSALIKFTQDKNDLLVSHNTWTGFETMRRVMKRYELPYRGVRAGAMSLSGYPGAVVSGDDFYVLGSGLVAQETTNSNNNAQLWSRIRPQGQVPEVVRVTVANRLADNGQSWTKIFSEFNSGTYNNQWMIVDMNKFSPGSAKAGLLWVAEQMPGVVRREDMTATLLRQGYWSSFNIPYFPDIYNLSGHPQLAKEYGDFFTHDKNPRSLIFKRDQEKVVDVASMMRLMRSNDFQHDPLSRCECLPPYSAENAIASRNDLNPANGTYPFHALSHRSSGATDAKVTSWGMSRGLGLVAVSGPTTGAHLPPFRWSTSGFTQLSHRGHPDIFLFSPVTITWSPLPSPPPLPAPLNA